MNRYMFFLIAGLALIALIAVAGLAYTAGSNAVPAPTVPDVAGRIAAANNYQRQDTGAAPWALIAAILVIVGLVAGALFLRQYGEAQRQRRLSKRRPRPYQNGHRPAAGLPQLPAPREGENDA